MAIYPLNKLPAGLQFSGKPVRHSIIQGKTRYPSKPSKASGSTPGSSGIAPIVWTNPPKASKPGSRGGGAPTWSGKMGNPLKGK